MSKNDRGRKEMVNGEFITLYTDASVRPKIKRTQVAWRGKCSSGSIQGSKILQYDSCVARAEMHAILYAVKDAIERYPSLIGFFVNSDNLECVQSFWTFRSQQIHKNLIDVHARILCHAGSRWIRAKHVKAHTGGADIRSLLIQNFC